MRQKPSLFKTAQPCNICSVLISIHSAKQNNYLLSNISNMGVTTE